MENNKTYNWRDLLELRKKANVTLSDLKKATPDNDIKICVVFSEYITLCDKDKTILENAINLIKSMGGEQMFQYRNDMTVYVNGVISFNKLKELVKQDTYKTLFKVFEFYLFEWMLTDWRDCELSLPRLVKFYPQIAKDLFSIY